VVRPFVSQTLVETHRELVGAASMDCFEVMFLLRILNARHFYALNVLVVEIIRMNNIVAKLVFQTNLSDNYCR
jgi:hypothetical protein